MLLNVEKEPSGHLLRGQSFIRWEQAGYRLRQGQRLQQYHRGDYRQSYHSGGWRLAILQIERFGTRDRIDLDRYARVTRSTTEGWWVVEVGGKRISRIPLTFHDDFEEAYRVALDWITE